jgi:hypothetical protein
VEQEVGNRGEDTSRLRRCVPHAEPSVTTRSKTERSQGDRIRKEIDPTYHLLDKLESCTLGSDIVALDLGVQESNLDTILVEKTCALSDPREDTDNN